MYFDPNPSPYVPSTPGDIYDMLGSMMLSAPTFRDKTLYFPDKNIDTEFQRLEESFGLVRKKLGEQHYSQVMDLSRRAKACYAQAADMSSPKAIEGWELLLEIEDIIQALRRGRARAKLKEEDGGAGKD